MIEQLFKHKHSGVGNWHRCGQTVNTSSQWLSIRSGASGVSNAPVSQGLELTHIISPTLLWYSLATYSDTKEQYTTIVRLG